MIPQTRYIPVSKKHSSFLKNLFSSSRPVPSENILPKKTQNLALFLNGHYSYSDKKLSVIFNEKKYADAFDHNKNIETEEELNNIRNLQNDFHIIHNTNHNNDNNIFVYDLKYKEKIANENKITLDHLKIAFSHDFQATHCKSFPQYMHITDNEGISHYLENLGNGYFQKLKLKEKYQFYENGQKKEISPEQISEILKTHSASEIFDGCSKYGLVKDKTKSGEINSYGEISWFNNNVPKSRIKAFFSNYLTEFTPEEQKNHNWEMGIRVENGKLIFMIEANYQEKGVITPLMQLEYSVNSGQNEKNAIIEFLSLYDYIEERIDIECSKINQGKENPEYNADEIKALKDKFTNREQKNSGLNSIVPPASDSVDNTISTYFNGGECKTSYTVSKEQFGLEAGSTITSASASNALPKTYNLNIKLNPNNSKNMKKLQEVGIKSNKFDTSGTKNRNCMNNLTNPFNNLCKPQQKTDKNSNISNKQSNVGGQQTINLIEEGDNLIEEHHPNPNSSSISDSDNNGQKYDTQTTSKIEDFVNTVSTPLKLKNEVSSQPNTRKENQSEEDEIYQVDANRNPISERVIHSNNSSREKERTSQSKNFSKFSLLLNKLYKYFIALGKKKVNTDIQYDSKVDYKAVKFFNQKMNDIFEAQEKVFNNLQKNAKKQLSTEKKKHNNLKFTDKTVKFIENTNSRLISGKWYINLDDKSSIRKQIVYPNGEAEQPKANEILIDQIGNLLLKEINHIRVFSFAELIEYGFDKTILPNNDKYVQQIRKFLKENEDVQTRLGIINTNSEDRLLLDNFLKKIDKDILPLIRIASKDDEAIISIKNTLDGIIKKVEELPNLDHIPIEIQDHINNFLVNFDEFLHSSEADSLIMSQELNLFDKDFYSKYEQLEVNILILKKYKENLKIKQNAKSKNGKLDPKVLLTNIDQLFGEAKGIKESVITCAKLKYADPNNGEITMDTEIKNISTFNNSFKDNLFNKASNIANP